MSYKTTVCVLIILAAFAASAAAFLIAALLSSTPGYTVCTPSLPSRATATCDSTPGRPRSSTPSLPSR